MFALGGLLALARFALCAAAWDTENGFALMGASRDLTISVFVEAALVLSLAVAALVAGTTDLAGMIAGTAGSEVWSSPGLALGAVGFALVVVAETGRQPIDNPDTHLELTMIHEGPLLEYGGRDLAYLQWGAAARHWIVLVLAAQIFVPHATGPWLQLVLLPVVLVVLCRRARAHGDSRREDAHPPRAETPRRRSRSRPARRSHLARGERLVSTDHLQFAVARKGANANHVSSCEAPFSPRVWGTSRFSHGGAPGSPVRPVVGRKAFGFPTPLHAHRPETSP